MVEGLAADAEGVAGELGHVIALQEQKVVLGVALGEEEGTVCTALTVEVGDVGACEIAVVASAAEDNPAVVARPGMVAVGIGAVGFGQRVAEE